MDDNNLLETVLNAYNERLKENPTSQDRIPDLGEVRGKCSNELRSLNSGASRRCREIDENFEVERKHQHSNSNNADVIATQEEKRPIPVKPKRRNKSIFMSDLDLGEPLSVQSIIDSVRENAENFDAVQHKDSDKTVESSDDNDTNNNPNLGSENDTRLPTNPQLSPEIFTNSVETSFNLYDGDQQSSRELKAECMKLFTSDSWLDDTESASDRATLICSDESNFLSDNATEPELLDEALSPKLRRKRQSKKIIDSTLTASRSDHSSADDSKRKSDSFATSSNLMKHGGLSVSVQSELDAIGQNRYKKFQRSISSRYKGKNKSRPLGDDKNVRKDLTQMFDAAATNAYAKLQKFKRIKLKASSQNDTSDSSAPKISSKQSPSIGLQGRINNKSMDKQHSEEEDLNTRRNSNSSCSLASLGGADKLYDDDNKRVLKSGWLRKQGGMIKTWNERWFVLRGDRLYYYKDKDENKVLGIIPLQGNHIIEHHNRTSDPNKFYFEIIPGGDRENLTKNHNTFLLSADSQSTVNEWVKLITRAMKAPPGGGVFGQELWRLIKHEKRMDSKLSPTEGTNREVPYVIEACCEFILENGVFNEEGLFRLPGQANEVKDLQHSFDMGVRPTFDKSTDPHTVASLMKSFFRELPEPLIPYDKYMTLIDAAKIMMPGGLPSFNKSFTSEPEERDGEMMSKAREIIKRQLETLPRDNFRLLRYLCRFLNKVQQHSTKNKMDVANLALMFGPNIIKSKKEEDPRIIMEHATYVQHIMSEFIRNHSYLLPDDENVSKKSSVPDVVPDAISCVNSSFLVNTSPLMSSQSHNLMDTVVSSHTTQTTSTEGFNTISTTTSPPGTFNSNRHHTDDSGTGSLGPTPDNTSRRNMTNVPPKMRSDVHSNRHKPVSAIMEEDGNATHTPTPNKPKVPSKPPRPHLEKDPRRESLYDNVTPPSETCSVGNPAQSRYREKQSGCSSPLRQDLVRKPQSISHGNVSGDRNTNPSPRSSYGNQDSPSASARSSTNAVAGSSVAGSTLSGEFEALSPYSPTLSAQEHVVDGKRISSRSTESTKGPKPPMRRKRSKKASAKHGVGAQVNNRDSDEESNTESVPPDDRSDSRFRLSSRQSSLSSINEPGQTKQFGAGKRPTQRPPPPPYPAHFPRAQGRSPPSTTDSSTQPTYGELQNNIRTLQGQLIKFEMRTRHLEESFMKQIHELRVSTSSFVADSSFVGARTPSRVSEFETPSNYWRTENSLSNHEDAFSYADSIADTVSESIRFDCANQRFDLESKITPQKDFKTHEEEVEYLHKCVTEEKKLREMTEIQLKNEKRGREMAEERNVQLQREMREFFCTFGSMFSNSETSSLQ